MRQSGAAPQVIAALDVESRLAAIGLVASLRGTIGLFKVGSRLFTAEGPGMIAEITEAGGSVFLDLKFHDIPATVAGAVRAACALRAFMMTIHAAGGAAMMRAAAEEAAAHHARTGLPRPLLVGVTVLTSMSGADLAEVSGYEGAVEDLVLRRAVLAHEAGLDGVVASVAETARIRAELGRRFVIVTPGIRPAGAGAGDQKRTATPREAAEAGADYLVVGRPISEAPDPAAAATAIVAGIAGAAS
ncbi:MAG: orotidine-5'-phosphate decarboxylase [Candidatus Krumholzibacteria bacterium]|nr:orotidine-5'-phosphate decarboxylase [Candidatus Krumholzibacteria bacterium]